MQIWLGTHEVASDQFALAMRGADPERLGNPAGLGRLFGEVLGEETELVVRKLPDGGYSAAAHSLRAHWVLRAEPAGGALLSVHCLEDVPRVLRSVEALVLRLQPEQVELCGIPTGGSSGLQPYMPEGALFVRMIESRRSPLQTIEVGEHPVYGRLLFLNGETQIASTDEALYTRSLVQPALRKRTQRACILGGGDCGVLRELLAAGLEEVVMVELDEQVIETAARHFPETVGGSREDPRARIVIGDAFAYIAEHGEFDLVVYDLSDSPLQPQALDGLLASLVAALRPGGRVAVQCGSGLPMYRQRLQALLEGLGRHFTQLRTREVVIPSFLEQPWVFAVASP